MRQNISDVDRWTTSQRRRSSFPLTFHILLLFSIQLFTNVVWHVVVTLQLAAPIYVFD